MRSIAELVGVSVGTVHNTLAIASGARRLQHRSGPGVSLRVDIGLPGDDLPASQNEVPTAASQARRHAVRAAPASLPCS
jgi:hypothetical protein